MDADSLSEEPGRVRGPRETKPRALVEAVCAALGASVLTGLLFRLPLPFVHDNLHAFIAALFLFLPQLLLGRRGDIAAYGLRARPIARSLRLAATVMLLVLPLFVGVFIAWNRAMCHLWPSIVPGSCWHLVDPSFRLPPSFLLLALAQLIVVALPEELFFRGYVQGRLEDALPPTRTFLGAKVGWAVVIQAALFGVGHFLVTFDPTMLTRFFPGLVFGWMYARTRSILPSMIFHATCNVLVEVLASSFL